MIERNNIYKGDCAELLKQVESNSIDLVITSPPYDDLRTYGGDNFGWCFNKFKEIVPELYRVMKDGGVVVWVVNDKTVEGSKTLSSFKQALEFKENGFLVNDVMIWRKTNVMPMFKRCRYTDCFEYMFIFSKGAPKTFNPLMVECKYGGKTYNSTAKVMGGESGRRELNYEVNREKMRENIWDIAVAQNKTNHPAVFPAAIAADHIESWSNEGDVVLDIFAGSGTTLMEAKRMRRDYIGFEISDEFYELCKRRVDSVLVPHALF